MKLLASAILLLMHFRHEVYGTEERIPTHPVIYANAELNGDAVAAHHRIFHDLLVILSEESGIPLHLQQRYGIDPYKTYCAQKPDSKTPTHEQEAMHNAVVMLLWERDIPLPPKEKPIAYASRHNFLTDTGSFGSLCA